MPVPVLGFHSLIIKLQMHSPHGTAWNTLCKDTCVKDVSKSGRKKLLNCHNNPVSRCDSFYFTEKEIETQKN